MSAIRKDITIDRSSRKTFKVKFNFDIGSATIRVVVYESRISETPIISVIPVVIEGEANTYRVTFSSADTNLLVNDKYIWGIKLAYPDGNDDIIIKGEVKVSWGLP